MLQVALIMIIVIEPIVRSSHHGYQPDIVETDVAMVTPMKTYSVDILVTRVAYRKIGPA